MKELKTFTTGKGTYDSFPDKTARAELPKKLSRPATAQVGDYLRIKAIGADGTMEVEAVPAPTKVSAFENDAGYATEALVQELLAEFPTFKIEVVQELPAVGAEKTIYLVPFADDSGSYLEYLYVNGAWEVVGNGKDSGDNGNDVFSPVVSVEQTDNGAVISITDKDGTTTATVKNGKDGKDGIDATPVTPLFANSVAECTDITKPYVLPDGYIYAYMKYTEEVVIPGETITTPGDVTYIAKMRYSLSSAAFKEDDTYDMLIIPVVSEGTDDLVQINLAGMVYDSHWSSYVGVENNSFTGDVAVVGTTGDTMISIKSIPAGKRFVTLCVRANDAASLGVTVNGEAFNTTVGTTETIGAKHSQTTVTEGSTEIVEKKGFISTGHAFVPADYEPRIIDLEAKAEDIDENTRRIDALESATDNLADYITSIQCPVQLPANGEDGSDFNLHTFADFGAGLNAYFDDLIARYPNYLVREYLGKDASGTIDMYRYILGKHYYSAWCNQKYPRMYAWQNGSTIIYSVSVSPRIGDSLYSTAYIGTVYGEVTAASASNRSRTVNSLEFERNESGDVEPTVYYTPAYNPYSQVQYADGSRFSNIATLEGNTMTDNGGNTYFRYAFGDLRKDGTKPIHMTIIANEHGGSGEPAIPTVVTARLIRDLCNGKLSSDNPIYRFLRDKVQLAIIPAVNPHGLNKYAIDLSNGYYNANSVNINRNYDTAGWDYCYNNQDVDGNSALGAFPGSENETQYVMNTMVDSKAVIAMSVHTITASAGTVQRTRCYYQGQNPNGGYAQHKINAIAEDMDASYNLDFLPYNPLECPPDTTSKSPSYITQIGAYGGIVEFQCHDPLATDAEATEKTSLFTDVVMEQNYSLLLKFITMWLSDYLEAQ